MLALCAAPWNKINIPPQKVASRTADGHHLLARPRCRGPTGWRFCRGRAPTGSRSSMLLLGRINHCKPTVDITVYKKPIDRRWWVNSSSYCARRELHLTGHILTQWAAPGEICIDSRRMAPALGDMLLRVSFSIKAPRSSLIYVWMKVNCVCRVLLRLHRDAAQLQKHLPPGAGKGILENLKRENIKAKRFLVFEDYLFGSWQIIFCIMLFCVFSLLRALLCLKWMASVGIIALHWALWGVWTQDITIRVPAEDDTRWISLSSTPIALFFHCLPPSLPLLYIDHHTPTKPTLPHQNRPLEERKRTDSRGQLSLCTEGKCIRGILSFAV